MMMTSSSMTQPRTISSIPHHFSSSFGGPIIVVINRLSDRPAHQTHPTHSHRPIFTVDVVVGVRMFISPISTGLNFVLSECAVIGRIHGELGRVL